MTQTIYFICRWLGRNSFCHHQSANLYAFAQLFSALLPDAIDKLLKTEDKEKNPKGRHITLRETKIKKKKNVVGILLETL